MSWDGNNPRAKASYYERLGDVVVACGISKD